MSSTRTTSAVCLYCLAPARYGLRGFYERDAKPIPLSANLVEGIQLKGGTMLVSTVLLNPLSQAGKLHFFYTKTPNCFLYCARLFIG